MTLSELIDHLIAFRDEINPDSDGDTFLVDPEVKVAYQPRWPLECDAGKPVLVDCTKIEREEITDYLASADKDGLTSGEKEELVKLLKNLDPLYVVYLAHVDSSHGYLDANAVSELDWHQ